MITVPGGAFLMGTDDPRSAPGDGDRPVHEVELSPFLIGEVTVTNDAFADFVAATGWVTGAERHGASFVFGGLLPDEFPPTRGVVGAPWWREVPGADWTHPEGPQSDLAGRGDHPVVHVDWFDAAAYCAWVGGRLPTEAEWERAARGGLQGAPFPWGHVREPGGEHLMNVFQGRFPSHNTGADGWLGTAPVRSYPPNGLGLYETTGNVWEWCADWFDRGWYRRSPRRDPAGPAAGSMRVMRGGSYLCHESYCWRYRVDARSASTPQSTAGNVGFRVAGDHAA
jgi:formylglycine-generating enzyme required for sulfatase activity